MSSAVHGIIDEPTGTGTRRRRIDVTGCSRADVERVLGSTIVSADVALEQRADRTFLVIDRPDH